MNWFYRLWGMWVWSSNKNVCERERDILINVMWNYSLFDIRFFLSRRGCVCMSYLGRETLFFTTCLTGLYVGEVESWCAMSGVCIYDLLMTINIHHLSLLQLTHKRIIARFFTGKMRTCMMEVRWIRDSIWLLEASLRVSGMIEWMHLDSVRAGCLSSILSIVVSHMSLTVFPIWQLILIICVSWM